MGARNSNILQNEDADEKCNDRIFVTPWQASFLTFICVFIFFNLIIFFLLFFDGSSRF